MVGLVTTCDIERPDISEVATIVSVDDHLIEPEDTFVGRLPGRFTDRQPRLVKVDASELVDTGIAHLRRYRLELESADRVRV